MTDEERADLQSAISVTLTRARKAAGITQFELGYRIGWSKGNICNLEAGRTGMPNVATLVAIADAIGVDAADLLRDALALARACARD